MPSELLCCRTK